MTVITMRGEYDAARHDELDQLLDRYGDSDPLAIDMHEVEGIDSGALRSLVRFQKARKEAGRSPAVLLQPSAAVISFLDLANVAGAFDIRDRA